MNTKGLFQYRFKVVSANLLTLRSCSYLLEVKTKMNTAKKVAIILLAVIAVTFVVVVAQAVYVDASRAYASYNAYDDNAGYGDYGYVNSDYGSYGVCRFYGGYIGMTGDHIARDGMMAGFGRGPHNPSISHRP